MNPPTKLTEIIDRRRYSCATATVLAGDDYWDGHNFERGGRNTWLYRTPKGAYFQVTISQWQGEDTTLTPLSEDEAIQLYERLSERRVSYKEAFPGVSVEDA